VAQLASQVELVTRRGHLALGTVASEVARCVDELVLVRRSDAKLGKVVVVEQRYGAQRVEAFRQELLSVFA
jgi:hypothetical protein